MHSYASEHTCTHQHTRTQTCRSRLTIRSWSCAQMYAANFYAAPHCTALRTLPFAFGTCDRRSNRQACVRIRVAVTLDSVRVVVAAVAAAVIVCCFSPCANLTVRFYCPVQCMPCCTVPRRAVALKLRKSPMAGAFNFWHTPLNVHFNNVDVVGHFTLCNFYCLPRHKRSPPRYSLPSCNCIVLLLLLQFVALSVGLSTVFRCFCLKRLT